MWEAQYIERCVENICRLHRKRKYVREHWDETDKKDVWGKQHDVRQQPHRTHDLHSGSRDHHPPKNSVQKTICCKSTSNTPADGRMYPKHVELRIHK